ncbi:hypothetical protein ANCDUO_04140 [Ancylostoma duodenale]|uniref:Uncharacterized protein n=1 Tax=Ancylostoma duodenale TaxID=51022 RepID=A0A0C2GVQ0_9BILA|nr:hypothetical protein ANCDUO_04140 [Ancylostoma duodenale]
MVLGCPVDCWQHTKPAFAEEGYVHGQNIGTSQLLRCVYLACDACDKMIAVQTHNCGVLHVYVQGNLEERNGKTIILTCHDVGTNCKV